MLVLYLAFYKSYLSEHGKQLALKEHVEELTKKVEKIKSEIEFFAQTRFDLATNERAAILDYHSKYIAWKNSILIQTPGVINEDNCSDPTEVFTNESHVKELHYKNSEGRLDLFLKLNEKFLDSRNKLNVVCYQLQHVYNKSFIEVQKVWKLYRIDKSGATTPAELKKIHEKMYGEYEGLLDKYYKNRLDKHKELLDAEVYVEQYLKDALFKDVEQRDPPSPSVND